ncbi:MAG: sigma-70 family RNA polymerase sigma factor [Deltaproteobacteria bacterium]|nr:sigma-70 family RNA polymerase sigma factor [Deltaproteobacteria bacterium]
MRLKAGDAKAHDEILPLVYEHLRALATSQIRGARDHTLQPTALVHELFLKLAGGAAADIRSRGHFMAVAATAMRQILIDHARRGGAQKRGGERARVSLADLRPGEAAELSGGGDVVDALALHDALERLAKLDPRQARLVELRVFGGMTQDEVAEVLGASLRTIEREWRKVRAWLARELAAEA